MGVQSTKLRYIAIKQESTPGTAVTVADADFDIRMLVPDAPTRTIEFDDEAAKEATGSHAGACSISGKQMGNVTFNLRMNYGSDAVSRPKWFKAAELAGLQAIGWDTGSEVVEGSAADGLSLVRRKAQDQDTYTIVVVDQTVGASPVYTARKYAGCKANAVFSCEGSGKPYIMQVTATGKFQGEEDGAGFGLAPTGFDTACAEKFLSSAVSLPTDGSAYTNAYVGAWQIDLGNTVSMVDDISDATGISHYVITDSNPTASMNILAAQSASFDPHSYAKDMDFGTLDIGNHGTDNLAFRFCNAQYLSPSISEREGLVAWDLSFRALRNGTTDSDLDDEDMLEILHGART